MSEQLDQEQERYEEPEITGCPKCGSNDIRRSKGDNFWAGLQRVFGRWPYRCRSCRSKFYRHSEPPEDFD